MLTPRFHDHSAYVPRLATTGRLQVHLAAHTVTLAVGYLAWSGTDCADQLGAPGRNRTCDTRFRKPLLYPLSYEGVTIQATFPACELSE
jgi:hypothetical protein